MREAVGSPGPVAAVARDLGVSPKTLRRWMREADGNEWAAQVERYFGFLSRYGFAMTDVDPSEWRAVRVIYRSQRSAVAVTRSFEYQRVMVDLIRLVDGQLPKYPIFVVDTVPVNWFDAGDLLGSRIDDADEMLAHQHGYSPEEIDRQLDFWSKILHDYGQDFLAGDLSVLDELEQIVRGRAGQHRQEVVIWLPESASADEEAEAIERTRTVAPEGVAVVTRRYRQVRGRS